MQQDPPVLTPYPDNAEEASVKLDHERMGPCKGDEDPSTTVAGKRFRFVPFFQELLILSKNSFTVLLIDRNRQPQIEPIRESTVSISFIVSFQWITYIITVQVAIHVIIPSGNSNIISLRPQILRKSPIVSCQGDIKATHINSYRRTPGKDRGARRRTLWGGNICTSRNHPLSGKSIDIGSANIRIAVTSHMISAMVIAENKQDIWTFSICSHPGKHSTPGKDCVFHNYLLISAGHYSN